MGRPSKSGLSIKQLGPRLYFRLIARRKPRKTGRRWWSGLSEKKLGHMRYVAELRKLRKMKTLNHANDL